MCLIYGTCILLFLFTGKRKDDLNDLSKSNAFVNNNLHMNLTFRYVNERIGTLWEKKLKTRIFSLPHNSQNKFQFFSQIYCVVH